MKKANNIRVIGVNNTEENLKIINRKFTLLVAELVKSGQLGK